MTGRWAKGIECMLFMAIYSQAPALFCNQDLLVNMKYALYFWVLTHVFYAVYNNNQKYKFKKIIK